MNLRAVLAGRCPRCREGRVFHGMLAMNVRCPHCGLVFEREQGYFLGAMYFSYALAIAVATPLCVALLLLGWRFSAILTACGVELLLLSPWIFRLSRVAWLHFDHRLDPP